MASNYRSTRMQAQPRTQAKREGANPQAAQEGSPCRAPRATETQAASRKLAAKKSNQKTTERGTALGRSLAERTAFAGEGRRLHIDNDDVVGHALIRRNRR